MTLPSLIEDRSIAVVLGEGGVGKTTVAAAMALVAASSGRRVLAMTVDPSNRLKDALSISGTPGVEEPVRMSLHGSLHAMVLDATTELDRVVARMFPDADKRRKVTENMFYRKAAALTGTHEYLAMDRVLEAHDSGRYDLIVLDTPPERHAIDFLEAPRRIESLLSHDAFRLFVSASSGFSRIGLSALKFKHLVLKGIGMFAGEDTFLKLLDFILAFAPVYEEYRMRALRARSMLTGPDCAAFIVCRPVQRNVEPVRSSLMALKYLGVSPAAVVVNHVHMWPPYGLDTHVDVDAAIMKDALLDSPALSLYSRQELIELADVALRLASRYRRRAEVESKMVHSMKSVVEGTPVFAIPALRDDIRDLESLATFTGIIRSARPV